MLNHKLLKEKLRKGEVVLGSWCEIPSPEVVNIMAKAGLDFVIIDMEHGAMDYICSSRMIIAAEVEGTIPFIRVGKNDESDILKALEIAPGGIIVPHIDSENDRLKAVSFAKLPPVGTRSYNPYTRAGGYHSGSNLVKINQDLILSLIIESKEGVQNLEKIINDKNVDILYIGTYDLSVALGSAGNTKSKIVTDTLKNLVAVIRKNNKIAGTMFHTKDEFMHYKKLGIQFLCYKVDTSVVFDEFSNIVNLLN